MSSENLLHDTDELLLRAARQGDHSAFSALYRKHHKAALRLARTLHGCDAEDVVAEAFAGLLRQFKRGGGPERNFRAYLLQAVRNAYVSEVRRHSRYLTCGDNAVLDAPVKEFSESTELLELVGEEFSRLADRERTALWMTLVEGYSLDEVGRRLQTTQGGAGALVYRARKRLKQALLAHATEPEYAALCRLAALRAA